MTYVLSIDFTIVLYLPERPQGAITSYNSL